MCVAELGVTDLRGDPDVLLCQVGELLPQQLVEARATLKQYERSIEERLKGVRGIIAQCAATTTTADLLTRALLRDPSVELDAAITPLTVRLNGRVYSIKVPNLEGFYAFYELLVVQQYKHEPIQVEAIYDLGAHIGVSAAYFNSVYPDAEIVCVEPAPENVLILEHNMARNPHVRSKILPAAVADASGEALFGVDSRSSMLNSAIFDLKFSNYIQTGTIALDELIDADQRYGIKIDIEGGEYDLRRHAKIIAGAQWVLGELHYGSFSRSSDVWLRQVLEEGFDLTLLPPQLSKYSSSYVISQNFQAIRRQSCL